MIRKFPFRPAALFGAALFSFSFFAGTRTLAGAADWWWPVQEEPAKLVVMPVGEFAGLEIDGRAFSPHPKVFNPEHTLAQSVAGLAAQAVNRGHFDEMLWIDHRSEASNEWLRRVSGRLDLATRESPGLWELVEEYHEAGVIEGYVLYRWETKFRDERGHGVDGDQSVNTGTMLAGLHRGILVTEEMEEKARSLGLRKLADAREVTSAEVFARAKGELANRWVLVQSPCFPFARDLAIAHRLPVVFGTGEFTETVYSWMPPGGLAIGWNNAHEDESVIQTSKYGHKLIPSDWSPNMTVLAAGAASRDSAVGFSRPAESLPEQAENEERPRMGLFMSDGDNLQWLLTTFTHNDSFWVNPRRGSFPIGWGLPVADLIQTAPDVLDYLVVTQTEQDSILVHLGYYYPDLFGSALEPAEREKALRLLGARIETTLRHSDTRLVTFLVHDLESPGAHEAYWILAESSPSMKAMYAIQYHPYEGGEGKTHWVTTGDGRKVPVLTARYALWAETSGRPRAGDLEALPGIVRRDIQSNAPVDGSWVILHAWSEFESGDGGMHMGATPAFDLFRALKDRVRFISFEDL